MIENYDIAFKEDFKGWVCHHRLELTPDGKFAYSAKDLIKLGLYYHRPHNELIFLRVKEHNKIHRRSVDRIKHKASSEFGIKYKKEFGLTKRDNPKLYHKEYAWYLRNGKCRWE